MGVLGSAFRLFWTRVLPVIVILLALIVGWFAKQELPLAVFFATVFPIMNKQLPPPIFGHGRMKGTIEVPDDMTPQPRPEHEMFLELPGGYKMPQNGIGMCCRPTAYDDVLVRRTVLWYLLLGGRLIDTAHFYLNHKAIGLGIQDAIQRGVPREEIFVTTKIMSSHFGYNTTLQTVPTYLDELGLDYIDLVLMHFPVTFPLMGNECKRRKISNQECREETWKALSELRDKGVMRNVGVSNFGINHLKPIVELDLAPVAVNQIQYNPWMPDHIIETFQYCQDHNIAITAYYSLGGSLQHSHADTVETLNSLAEKHNKTLAQVMLRWALQSNAAIIPGTGNPNHMRENLAIYEFELSDEDMVAVNELRRDEDAKKFFYMAPPKD